MMPHAEYIASLPKRHVASAALLFNSRGELLIVQQNYKQDGWSVPGGIVDALESPHDGCVREIKEEIGLDVPRLTFVGVQYSKKTSNEPHPYDSIEFTFSGGVLTDEQIAHIVLQSEEIGEYRFCPTDEALTLLRSSISIRVRAGLEAISRGTPTYTEYER